MASAAAAHPPAKINYRAVFLGRLAAALRRRLDAGSIDRNAIAAACDVTRSAVSLWLAERNEPGGFAVIELVRLFGDDFLHEISGRRA